MEIKLDEKEMTSLTQTVVEELKKQFVNNSIVDNIYKDADKVAKRLIEIHNPERQTKWNTIEYLTPIISKLLKENNLLDRIVNKQISEYMSSDNFKKKNISMLKRRIEALEEELYSDDDA